MKAGLSAIFTLTLLLAAAKSSFSECVLGVRAYPLRYVGATQTVDFRVAFKSNCMDFASLNFFILPYDKDFNLTRSVHPQRVILSVYGRVYQFDFSEPRRNGRGKAMNILYTKVRLQPARAGHAFSTMRSNDVILRTSAVNAFKRKEINSLYYKQNPCLCKLSKNKGTMYCEINK